MLSIKDVKNIVADVPENIQMFFGEVLASIAEGAAGAKQMAAEALKVLEVEVAGEPYAPDAVDAALKSLEKDGLVEVVTENTTFESDPTPQDDPDFEEPAGLGDFVEKKEKEPPDETA